MKQAEWSRPSLVLLAVAVGVFLLWKSQPTPVEHGNNTRAEPLPAPNDKPDIAKNRHCLLTG